jgi:hypothetical protein
MALEPPDPENTYYTVSRTSAPALADSASTWDAIDDSAWQPHMP